MIKPSIYKNGTLHLFKSKLPFNTYNWSLCGKHKIKDCSADIEPVKTCKLCLKLENKL
jgi:hypothetical protein